MQAEWLSSQDEEGTTYYYNIATGVSQWERPEGFVQPVAVGPAAAIGPSQIGCHLFSVQFTAAVRQGQATVPIHPHASLRPRPLRGCTVAPMEKAERAHDCM
jgi:hypothetical protein